MFFTQFAVGALQCNCSILACEKTKEAVLIDPGDDAPHIISILNKNQFKLKYILHTHAHFDHIGATHQVNKVEKGICCLHEGDQFLYDNVALQTSLFGFKSFSTAQIDLYLKDQDKITFGEHQLQVMHTPGHSPGSLCFYAEKENILFSGDTLFNGGIGRTDLWGGDTQLIMKSIHEKILSLKEETKVVCGHGPNTQIGTEKFENPFLREF